MKVKNQPGRKNNRRVSALERKTADFQQLQSKSAEEVSSTYANNLAKEITVLNERITTDEVAKSTKTKKNREGQGKYKSKV